MNLVALSSGVGLLALGCILLLWGAEVFLQQAGGLFRQIGRPGVVVALSLALAEPEEFVTALVARADGHPGLAAAQAVGANVTMPTLGLGLALLVSGRGLEAGLRVYAVLAVVAGLAAAAALLDGRIGPWEGLLLCAAYVAAVVWVGRTRRRPAPFGEAADLDPRNVARRGWRPLVWALLGLAGLLVGAALSVDGAATVAARTGTGTGERATGLTILAFSTSAEVLALLVAARRHRLTSLAIAGVLGSLVYNATLTLGAASLAGGLEAPGLAGVAVLAAVLPLALLLPRRSGAVRAVGGLLAVGYVAYLALVLGEVL